MHSDSEQYKQKTQFFKRMLTIYGRNPVLEALQTPGVTPYRLHLAESNKPSPAIQQLVDLATQKNAEICYHSKAELSRISKNAKQDQGVALDIQCEKLNSFETFLEKLPQKFELLALDGVTNPQNLGMIIRSACASPMFGLLLPEKGCAKLDALVIKASAGTLFKASIIRCANLAKALAVLKQHQSSIYGLDVNASATLKSIDSGERSVFVLGNESVGLSKDVEEQCTDRIQIPMCNGVESLNVSITAALIAFRQVI